MRDLFIMTIEATFKSPFPIQFRNAHIPQATPLIMTILLPKVFHFGLEYLFVRMRVHGFGGI
jgi:hypothetical protein